MWIKAGFAAAWLGATALGLVWVMRYDNQPGMAAVAPEAWPASTMIPLDRERPTLVMLAHPRCDCTRASLGELAELMARAAHRPKAFVVFIKPAAVGDDWEQTALWRAAERIPGVTPLRDDHGHEATRFGATTSGQVLLYEPGGRLLFSGGTTAARGKSGDNAGRATLVALLNGDTPRKKATPVFGCSLFGPGDEPAEAVEHDHGL